MFTTMDYNKPFLITYLCTSTFTLYLIRPLYSYLRRRSSGKETTIQGAYQVSAVKSTEPLEYVSIPLQYTETSILISVLAIVLFLSQWEVIMIQMVFC